MNKKIILSIGLPVMITHATGQRACIELNKNECVVCRFHPNNSVYLADATLKNWFTVSLYIRAVDQFKIYKWSNSSSIYCL